MVAAASSRYGYVADIVDKYGVLTTDPIHSDLRQWWQEKGIRTHDIDLQTPQLRLPFDDETFDLVTIIEHFPHTPRLVLEEIRRVVRPDGLVIVDAPNGASFVTRVGFLLHGEGLWAPVWDLYDSEIPFPGHTRCYSTRELMSVLEWAGLAPDEPVLLDLEGTSPRHSVKARVLYDAIYPVWQRAFPGLRGYIWVAARPSAGRSASP